MTLEERAREVAKEILEWSSQLAWDDHGLDEVDSNGYMSFATRHILAFAEQVQRDEREACVATCDRVAGMSMAEVDKLVPGWTSSEWGSEMLCVAAIRQRGKEGGE